MINWKCLFGKHVPQVEFINRDGNKIVQRCCKCGKYQIFNKDGASTGWSHYRPSLESNMWRPISDLEEM